MSNARDLQQIGYYRVTGTSDDNPSSNSWDVAWYDDDPPRGKYSRKSKKRGGKASHRRGDYVYLMDMDRGVEVIRLKRGAAASARMKSVVAPSVRKNDPWGAKLVAGSSIAEGGYVCPLITRY